MRCPFCSQERLLPPDSLRPGQGGQMTESPSEFRNPRAEGTHVHISRSSGEEMAGTSKDKVRVLTMSPTDSETQGKNGQISDPPQ